MAGAVVACAISAEGTLEGDVRTRMHVVYVSGPLSLCTILCRLVHVVCEL